MKALGISFLLISISTCALFSANEALNEAQTLHKVIWSPRQSDESTPMNDASLDIDTDTDRDQETVIPLSAKVQRALRKADKIASLPGQPKGVAFVQYSGYITVNQKQGRELFYYLVESLNASSKPLVLWLNGGPGCSSLGYGAFQEVGPFRVNDDAQTLKTNMYSWNRLANVLFLESPAGVGYSKAKDNNQINGDDLTAKESYTFLLNWLERFPQYKNRHFYMAGESYAGHYIPQLADLILTKNAAQNKAIINLKGVAIGNPYVDKIDNRRSQDEYFWRREFITDEGYALIKKECEIYYKSDNFTLGCEAARNRSNLGEFDAYNIYAPICVTYPDGSLKKTDETELGIDPCIDTFTENYLNKPEVKKAFHADRSVTWMSCSNIIYPVEPDTTVPIIKKLVTRGLRVLLYSGDIDSVVPMTTTKKSVKALRLRAKEPWRPWNCDEQIGGFVEEYEGLTFATVRGAGHQVPSNQPMRSFLMFSHFLQGKSLPKAPFIPRFD